MVTGVIPRAPWKWMATWAVLLETNAAHAGCTREGRVGARLAPRNQAPV